MRKFYSKEIVPIVPKIISVASQQQQQQPQPPRRESAIAIENALRQLYRKGETPGTFQDESLEYLRVFFNFGYFFHYLPYRFKRSPTTGAYITFSTLPHKIICALVHIFTLFRFITVLREVQVTHTDPTSYFVIARNFATCIYMFTFMVAFWKNQLVFQDIFKEIGAKCQLFNGNPDSSLKLGRGFSLRTIAYTLCIVYTIISLLNVLVGHGLLRMSEWSVRTLVEKHAAYTRFMFFLNENATDPELTDDPRSSSGLSYDETTMSTVLVYFLTVVHLGIHFYFKLGAHYADLSILVCALTLQHLTRRFTESFLNHGQDHVQSILDQYTALKIVARKINIGIGAITLCCMLEAMPYYATHIGDILSLKQEWFVRFRYMFFIVNFCSIIFVAADISHKVGLLQEWLNEDFNYNLVPQPKLIVLTNELTYSRIGLSAMGLFNITYGFVGSLISIVVTYMVIILQFKTSLEACQH